MGMYGLMALGAITLVVVGIAAVLVRSAERRGMSRGRSTLVIVAIASVCSLLLVAIALYLGPTLVFPQ